MAPDKMVYGQNGTDILMEAIFFIIDYSSGEFNTHLIPKSHKYVISTQRVSMGVKIETGLMKESYCQWERD